MRNPSTAPNPNEPFLADSAAGEKTIYEKPEISELGDWQNVTEQVVTPSLKSPFWDLFKGG